MPTSDIRFQHGSINPIGINLGDKIGFISVERAKSLIDDLKWAIEREEETKGEYDVYMCMHCDIHKPCYFKIENGSDAPEVCPLKGSIVAKWILTDKDTICRRCLGSEKVPVNEGSEEGEYINGLYVKPCPDCAGKKL